MSHKPPQSSNLRRGRYSEPNRAYFITSSCDRRVRFFENDRFARIALKQAKLEKEKGDCRSLAIVVMPDHLHWPIQLGDSRSLQQIVGSMKGRTAFEVNRELGRCGRLWQPGFHDHAIRADEDLRALYLLHNPVRAGLVGDYWDYPYWESVWHDRG